MEEEELEAKAELKAYSESILEIAPSGALTMDEHARFSYVNPVFLKWVEREAKDFIGKAISEVSPPFTSHKWTEVVAESVKTRVATGEPIIGEEIELIDKNGNPIPVSYSAAGIRDEEGNIVGVVVFFMDLRAEKAISEREEEIRKLFHHP